jgi:hypothetical protein
MLNDYRSRDPILFTVLAALIFAFTSAVFLVYDRLVEKRQKTVMTTAVHTSAIVSSLFPSTVRERLFENDNEATGNGPQPGESFVLLGDTVVSRPIADLYPSATVMFADMYVVALVRGKIVITSTYSCWHPIALVSLLGVPVETRPWCSICLKISTGHLISSPILERCLRLKQSVIAVSSA